MKRKLFFLATLLLATVMNLHAEYYMAGNGSATNNWCCGMNWRADGCEMTAGAYSTKVPAGTYEFKITEGDWTVSYGVSSVDASASTSGYEGTDNVKFTVAAEANINVTFDGMYIVLTSDVPFGSVTITSWTIAGDEAMMGSKWDPADTNNDMSLEGGVYQLVKKAYLPEGGYDYKACANHAWGVKEIPASGNQTLQIDNDGDYEITFTLDAAGTTLSAVAELDAPSITLTFDMQGHGEQVEPQTIASGEKFEKPDVPTAEGFEFGGWFQEAACDNAFDFNKTFTSTQDSTITIYAKWTEVKSVKKGSFATGDEDGFVMNEDIEVTISPAGTISDGQLNFSGTLVISGKGSLIHGFKIVYEGGYMQCEGKDVPMDGSLFTLAKPALSCTFSLPDEAPKRKISLEHALITISSLEVIYEVIPPDMHDFLHFVGLNGNDTVRLDKRAGNATILANLTATFEYSKDRKTWTTYDTWGEATYDEATYLFIASGNPVALNQGDTVFFRAKGTNGLNATMNAGTAVYFAFAFGTDDSIAAGGNTMSLYDATCEQDTMTEFGFYSLFMYATQLVSAPKLPATQLAERCYGYIFANCTSLTTAPALPATTLLRGCYSSMFNNCTALTAAPELPATTLAEDCYLYMFKNCTSLTAAPALSLTSLAVNCYCSMFEGCTSLTTAPALPATTLQSCCYVSMFKGCTALTAAPKLNATALASSCYSGMFQNCTALTQAPELKATTLAKNCYKNMFNGCTSLQVDTCADGSCDGVLFEPTTSGDEPATWNKDMFSGCKGDYTNVVLGGHYCIKGNVPACKIGDKEYESIAAAIAEVKAGDTIRVMKDIQLNAVIEVIPTNPAFTLDLNGHILDGSKLTEVNQSLIYNYGTLSIIDSNPTATHAAPFDTITGAIMTGGKGWKDGWGKYYGGVIYSYGTNLRVDGVTFVNNTASYGGVVYSYQTPSTFTNSRFVGNTATQYGSALHIVGSTCTVDSCIFQKNTSYCGTISCEKQATIHVNGSAFVKDSASYGGAVYAYDATSTFKNCRFEGNKTDQYGAALYLYHQTSTIDSCVFQNNVASEGIIFSRYQDALHVNGSEFVGNTASYGGAAYTFYTPSTFKNCRFEENTATSGGAALRFEGNYSSSSIDSCVFQNNTAYYGTIYIQQRASVSIAHTTITENNATNYFGAIGVYSSSLTLNDGTVITNNTSGGTYPNAGIYVRNYDSSISVSGKVIIKDNTTNGQPANLCLCGVPACDTIALNGLSAGSEIHVSTIINDTVTPSAFATNATEADRQYFVSDAGFAILRDNTILLTKDTFDYLHFVGLNGNDTVRLDKRASNATKINDLTATFEYSKDRLVWTEYTWGEWDDLDRRTKGNTITLNQGDTVFFRAKGTNGKNATMSLSDNTYFLFSFGTDDSIAAGGNIMSLYDAKCEQDTMTAYGFTKLFAGGKLVSAPKLTATKMAENCYLTMFVNCLSLAIAPELKATTLAKNCYRCMFDHCLALTTPPALPAETLVHGCYDSMFQGCTALTTAPALPATTLANYCYCNMFWGCTSLTQIPELKATTLADYCYFYMFGNCTSLEVDTCSGSCGGVMFEPVTGGAEPTGWNSNMFDQCHVYSSNVKLNGHYYVGEWQGLRDMQMITTEVDTIYTGTQYLGSLQMVVPTLANISYSLNNGATWSEPSKADKMNINAAHAMDMTLLVKATYTDYKDTTLAIKMKVAPRQVTMTSASDSMKYNSTALTAPTVTETGDGFVAGEGADYDVTGSQTEIGTSDNEFTYVLKSNTRATDYTFDTIYGTLKVDYISTTPVAITIASLSKTYDGQPLNASYSATNLVGNDSAVVRLDTTTLTDAGKIGVRALDYAIVRGDTNVTNGYLITPIQQGSLEITTRPVTLTSATDSKPFDNTAIVNKNITVSGDQWAPGEGATYTVTGTQTLVGQSANTFTYTLNANTKASNYQIDTIFGTLAVYNIYHPTIVGMYDKWNIVLNVTALEDSMEHYQVDFVDVEAADVTWYKVKGDMDEINPITGAVEDDEKATPANGLYHTEAQLMNGSYYAVVQIPEAKDVMGISFFQSNAVFMDAQWAPAYLRHDAQEDTSIIKKIVDGQLVIIKNGEMFNAQGQAL